MTAAPTSTAQGVWRDLVGQSETVALLRRAAAMFEQARAGESVVGLTHAWLFTGPPGSGRSTAARAFAAALQCEAGGCGSCQACRTVLAGSNPDVIVTATEATVITVAQARDLVQVAQRHPSQGRWRVMLVEDADRLNEPAFNALLKAIEEPPPRTLWLLCAPSPHDVAVTIRSRCRAVRLRMPSVQAVCDLLVERGADPAMAAYAARAAQCHIGRAARLVRDEDARLRRREVLDLAFGIRGLGDAVLRAGRLIEVANEESAAATTDRDASEKAALVRALGYEGQSRIPPAIRAQVRALEAEQKKRATRYKRDVIDRALLDLLSVYRDVLVVQLGADVELVNGSERDRVASLANSSSAASTLRRMDAVARAGQRITTSANPLMVVEAMLVQIAQG
jgi:DNA polymerase-3 subunit delta'